MPQTAIRANRARRIATALLVAVLLWPVVQNRDGLPLSTYPMYAGTRTSTVTLVTATGVAADGEPIALSMREIAQTLDPLIAQSFLNDAVATGRASEVCEQIAGRATAAVVSVEIAREQRDAVAYARDEPSLLTRDIVAACEVPE